MYMLEVNQTYTDTKFKTEDFKPYSQFDIELPTTINIPDDTTAYINDIVLPVSWTTIDEINNKLQCSTLHYADGGYDTSYWILPTYFKNQNGSTLAEALM